MLSPLPQIGPYRVLREIGSGGMATVHLAEDAHGRRLALKVVHTHLAEDATFFRRFRREGELGRRIRHGNVVSTLDSGRAEVGGRLALYLALEYVEGQTLRALLEDLQRVPEELCRHIGCEVAKGLEAIHAVGAIHRDLKPENILITPDHVVKVGDLGVARLVSETLASTDRGAFTGTVLYAAPEQFSGEYDSRADLYALGLVLYELATGRHPFHGDDPIRIMGRQLNEQPRPAGELNPQLSAFFEEVLQTLLAKTPEGRFPSAAALRTALEEREASAWWAERARSLRATTRRPLRRPRIPRETALVGRDAELAMLRAAYDRAKDGEGRVVLVEGEAGIGKTRLCDEFVGRLAAEGESIHYLFGAYPPGEAATASGAFSTAYREHFGGDADLGACLKNLPLLVDAFAALLRGEPPPPDAVPLTRESLQTVFIEATRALAAERPTILLVDDLQFAPAEGRALLAALAMAVPHHRILLLVTARPGLPAGWLAELERMEHATRIEVPRLGPKDLARLLVEAFRSEHLAEELGFRIAQKSDGNPFFAFEIIRSLREGRLLERRDDGTWVRTGVIEGIQIPSSVRDLIQARMADLEPEDRDLLEAASCCGFEFDPGLVAEALGVDLLGALRRYGQIERKHRLIRSAGRRCVFDHHQVQEALYGGLLAQLREQYHLAIARALERRTGGGPGGAEAVALCEHFLKSARPEGARPYLDRALAQVERDYGADAPANVARLAVAAPGLLLGRERAGMLLRFGRYLGLTGRREEEQRVLDEALALATELGDKVLAARALERQGTMLLQTARFEEARPRFEEALALARETGSRGLEATNCGRIGVLLHETDRSTEALPWHERQLALAREVGDRSIEADAINNIGNVHRATGRPREALAHYDAYLSITRVLNNRAGEAAALGNLGLSAADRGDFEEARTLHGRQLELTRAVGDRRGEARALGALAVDSKHLGFFEDAERYYRRAIGLAREIGHRIGESFAQVNLARMLAREGDFAGARALLAAAEPILAEAGTPRSRGYVRHVLGEVEALEGHAGAAEARFGEALALYQPDDAERAETLAALGALTGDEAALDEALALAARHHLADVRLDASCARAALTGDADAAREAYEELGPRAECVVRMDAAFALHGLTGDRAFLDTARDLLAHIERHAPEERRAALLACPPQARIRPPDPPGAGSRGFR
jgi:tetratricopeptide (TPR) repeat protein